VSCASLHDQPIRLSEERFKTSSKTQLLKSSVNLNTSPGLRHEVTAVNPSSSLMVPERKLFMHARPTWSNFFASQTQGERKKNRKLKKMVNSSGKRESEEGIGGELGARGARKARKRIMEVHFHASEAEAKRRSASEANAGASEANAWPMRTKLSSRAASCLLTPRKKNCCHTKNLRRSHKYRDII